jgi:HSP20 family protein
MADNATKLPIKTGQQEAAAAPSGAAWHPLENLHREIDRMFDDFGRGMFRWPFGRPSPDIEPFWRSAMGGAMAPAADLVEKEKGYEISVELPGLDEKHIDIRLASGTLTIRGEKHEEKEEKQKDYYLSERRYGSFQRSFRVPEGVDADKIEARYAKGVLSVTLPKSAEAQKKEKTIAIKAA